MILEELRARLETIEAERRSIHTAAGEAALSGEQQTRWEQLDADETDARAQLAEAEEAEARRQRVNESRAKWGSVQIGHKPDPFAAAASPTASRQALVDGIIRANEHRDIDADNERHFERLLKRHAGDRQWASSLLGRSRPEYERGFSKMMLGRPELLTEEERTAMTVGSNTNGGYLLPTHLDPTLILTNSGSSNVVRGMSRVVTLVNGETTWHGVTTAGVTASFDGELAEVSDDTPTLGSVSIPTYVAQGFVHASIAAFQDIDGLSQDVMMLFADARDRLEGAKHVSGAGSTEPTGIVTALDASTSVEITSTTAATIGEVDLHAVYKGVPVRWRGKSTWLTNPTYALAVKRLGTAVSSSYSGDLTQPVSERWIGRPVVESDDMPTTQTTTALDNEIILGDFSNYVVVDKPGGMSVYFIPPGVLSNTSNNRPDGRVGWLAYWRTGADASNISAFRLLQDKTSA